MSSLKIRRVNAGVSQARLSLLSGVGRFKIHQAEMGYRSLAPKDARNIDRALTKLMAARKK